MRVEIGLRSIYGGPPGEFPAPSSSGWSGLAREAGTSLITSPERLIMPRPHRKFRPGPESLDTRAVPSITIDYYLPTTGAPLYWDPTALNPTATTAPPDNPTQLQDGSPNPNYDPGQPTEDPSTIDWALCDALPIVGGPAY
jgi:hypothetical protein